MGDCYLISRHISMPIATITSQGLSWYALDRYRETKGIKFKKMTKYVFPRLGW
jgi:hypothetical protein